MKPEDYFHQLLAIEPYYETEGIFFESFWDFMYKFQSLQRHWELNKGFIQNHISILKSVKGDGSAEFDAVFSETANVDIEYFPEYLRLSTLSFSLSLVEKFLGSLSEEVANDLGIKLKLEKNKLPYINKYILWLTRGRGIDIDIDNETWKNIDKIREIRNRFIHRISKDIPDVVKKAIIESDKAITDEFVDVALMTLANLVKTIELAYIEFYEKRKIANTTPKA